MQSGPPKRDEEEEARRILLRVAQEADGSSMAERGAPSEGDWIEETGTRIGRLLGPLLLLGCALWLLFHVLRGG